MWEPVVERVPPINPQGKSKRWDMNVTVEYHASSYLGSGVLSPNFDQADSFDLIQNLPPCKTTFFVSRKENVVELSRFLISVKTISIQSLDFLQITVTKVFINVLKILYDSFEQDLNQENKKKKSTPLPPLMVINKTGQDISVFLDKHEGPGRKSTTANAYRFSVQGKEARR